MHPVLLSEAKNLSPVVHVGRSAISVFDSTWVQCDGGDSPQGHSASRETQAVSRDWEDDTLPVRLERHSERSEESLTWRACGSFGGFCL